MNILTPIKDNVHMKEYVREGSQTSVNDVS